MTGARRAMSGGGTFLGGIEPLIAANRPLVGIRFGGREVRFMIPSMRRIFLLSLVAAGAALAQNSDLGVLAGVSKISSQTTVIGASVGTVGSVWPNFQLNYAWQVLQRRVDLYVELPLTVQVRLSGETVTGPALRVDIGNAAPDIYFTPGVRLKISPQSRVSFYGAAGFGIASFGATSFVLPGPVSVSNPRQNSPAFDFGGGVDIRLTRLLSLRGEVRDFVTYHDVGGETGRHHAIFQFGIAFHF